MGGQISENPMLWIVSIRCSTHVWFAPSCWKNDVKSRIKWCFWGEMTMSVTPWKVIPVLTMTLMGTCVQVLGQNLCLLLFVILHRRSRFVDYIGHLGQTISRQKRVLKRHFSRLNLFLIQCANEFYSLLRLDSNLFVRV